MRHGFKTALVAAVLYGGLLCAAVALFKGPIEGKLEGDARAALAELEADGAELTVSFQGRDALLAGMVFEPGQVAAASLLVEELVGVRVVDNGIELRLPPPLEPASFAVEQIGENQWAIDGQVASETVAARLEKALRGSLPEGAEIEGRLGVDQGTVPAIWSTAVEGWLGDFRKFVPARAGFAVLDQELFLVGDVYSEERRAEILEAVGRQFAECDLSLNDELQLVAPPERSTIAIVASEGGGYSLHGQLRDGELLGRLVELVDESGNGEGIEKQVVVGDHVATAVWGQALVQVVPALVAEVEGLQLAISGDEFLMVGNVRSAETRTALIEVAGQAFQEVSVKIDNQLVVVAPPQAASLSIARSENGAVRLDGLLADPAIGRPFIEAAQAFCGPDGELVSAISHGQGVEAAPWLDKMADLVPVFIGAVSWGALSVHGDQVALEAEVIDAENGDVLQALVENAFPLGEFKRLIEIRVAIPQGPSDEQVMALESAVNGTVIYFGAEGSKLRAPQKAKLEALAEAFVAVPGASLALLGNRSEEVVERRVTARCEAVRAALEELGVERLLMEIELRDGDVGGDPEGRVYESGHRVEFELR